MAKRKKPAVDLDQVLAVVNAYPGGSAGDVWAECITRLPEYDAEVSAALGSPDAFALVDGTVLRRDPFTTDWA